MDFISIKITQGLDCNNICKQVQELVNKYAQAGKIIDNSFLDIRISNTSCTIESDKLKLPNYDNKGFYK